MKSIGCVFALAAGVSVCAEGPGQAQAVAPASQADDERLNVANFANYATAVASAKVRKRYIGGAGALIDGDPATFWNAGDAGPQWVQVNWKFPRWVERLRLRQRASATVASFVVSGKMSGAIGDDWEELARGRADGEEVVAASWQLRPVKAIRVALTPRTPDTVLELAELQAFTTEERLPQDLLWRADWIWLNVGDASGYNYRDATKGRRCFRWSFDVPDKGAATHARLIAAANHSADIFVNGEALGKVRPGSALPDTLLDFKPLLRTGRNTVAVEAYFSGAGGWAGFMAEGVVDLGAGQVRFATGEGWKASLEGAEGWRAPGFDDSKWGAAEVACSAYGAPEYVRWTVVKDVPYRAPGVEEEVRLRALRLPERVRPGEWATIAAELSAERPLRRDYTLVLKGGLASLEEADDYSLVEAFARPRKKTSLWGAGEAHEVSFEVWVPEYAPPGFAVDLEISGTDGTSGLRVSGGPPAPRLQVAGGTAPGAPAAAGVAAAERDFRIVRQGQKSVISWRGAVVSGRHAHVHKRFESLHTAVQAGYPILLVGSYPSYLVDVPENEDANVAKCFAIIDRQCRLALAYNPKCLLVVGLIYRATPEFIRAFPGECVKLPDGRVLRPSTASPRFRDACLRVTDKLLDKLGQQPYTGGIIGFGLAGFEGGTFRWWGYNRGKWGARDEIVIPVDVSEPALAAFRQWLRRKYGDEAALRAAWGDEGVTFDGARPPVEAFRRDYGSAFIDPIRARPVLDYSDFRNDTAFDFRVGLAKRIKERYDGRVLIQTHSSMLDFGIFAPPTGQLISNGDQASLAASPFLDSMGQNHAYYYRRRERHYAIATYSGSLQSHNKVAWSELDNRTFLSALADYKEYSCSGTIALERLNFGADLCLGMTERRLNFEMGRRGQSSVLWNGLPELVRELRNYGKIEDFANETPWVSDKDVAVFVNHRSLVYADVLTPIPTYNRMHHLVFTNLNLTGAPYDLYHLQDVGRPRVREQYKLYVFLNAEVMAEEERAAIEKHLKRDGKTLLWLWAPGFIDERTGFAPDRVASLTGMKTTIDRTNFRGRIDLDRGHELARGFGREAFGICTAYVNRKQFVYEYNPHFWVADEAAEVAGVYPHNGKPGLAVKRFADWTSVFCGICYMPVEVLRNAARLAGAHVYVDDAAVYANACRDWVVLHSMAAEARRTTLKLKRPSQVFDVFGKRRIADRAEVVEVDLAPYETKLFYLGRRDVQALAGRVE